MNILFYKEPSPLQSTLLTWTLAQELIMLGHYVDFVKVEHDKTPSGFYDWIYSGGEDTWEAIRLAQRIGAKVHIHSEGIEPWRVGLESAIKYGYNRDCTANEIKGWKDHYSSWMSGMYEADTCSLNGTNQVSPVEDHLFGGRKLANCYMRSCGSDWRFARTIGEFKRKNYMVTVSRLSPNKRLMVIAMALSMLDTENLPLWVIIGYGTKQETDSLVSFCKTHKIRFTFGSSCFGAEKWMWIRKARIMLSGYGGIQPGESLLCDTPILSMDHIDIEEQYRDAIFFAKDFDAEDFASKLQTLLSSNQSVLYQQTTVGKRKLINGDLYGCTQEISARRLEKIFLENM